MQIVQTLIRRRVLRRLIWIFTVRKCPCNGMLDLNGLNKIKLVIPGKCQSQNAALPGHQIRLKGRAMLVNYVFEMQDKLLHYDAYLLKIGQTISVIEL